MLLRVNVQSLPGLLKNMAYFQSCTMLVTAVMLLPHLCAILAAFTPTQSQATLADQDAYVKHPQQQPLNQEELKVPTGTTQELSHSKSHLCFAGPGRVDWQFEQ